MLAANDALRHMLLIGLAYEAGAGEGEREAWCAGGVCHRRAVRRRGTSCNVHLECRGRTRCVVLTATCACGRRADGVRQISSRWLETLTPTTAGAASLQPYIVGMHGRDTNSLQCCPCELPQPPPIIQELLLLPMDNTSGHSGRWLVVGPALKAPEVVSTRVAAPVASSHVRVKHRRRPIPQTLAHQPPWGVAGAAR